MHLLQETMTPLRLIPLLGGAAAVSFGIYRWSRSRRKTPEQREQERRTRIREMGRITDGTVLDAQEMVIEQKPVQLVIYQYDVGGVTYEASQDITTLRQYVDLHTCRIGLPASIKYDPHNPGNSIVIAEGWSGLRL
jgi:hypothetical protein